MGASIRLFAPIASPNTSVGGMTVYYTYIIHFNRKLCHARHYIGMTQDIRTRFAFFVTPSLEVDVPEVNVPVTEDSDSSFSAYLFTTTTV